MKEKIFAEKIIQWHIDNKRNFDWRNTRDPYRIIVAEIMLQKTDAEKVKRVYKKFVKKYPSPEILSRTDIDEIKNQIFLLGIHKRAERLKKISLDIMINFGGKVPKTKEDLIKLYGVGDYIANAVLCFAYGEEVPLLDTNIIRILERVFSIKSNKARPRTDRKIWEIVASMIPKGKAKDFNLALLDFGAEICKAKNPKHDACPVRNLCDHYNEIT